MTSNISISKDCRGWRMLVEMGRDPLNFFVNLMIKYGAYVWLRIKGRNVVLLSDATGIEHVLQSKSDNYCKGYFHKILKPLFGRSVFLVEGESWRNQRRNAAPVFSNKNYPEIVYQVVCAVQAMLHRWEEKVEQEEPIDIALEMTGFTFDALLRALFHEARDDIALNMRSTLDVILGDAESRMWSYYRPPVWITHRLPRYRRAQKFLSRIVEELIEARLTNNAYPEDVLSRLISYFGKSPSEQSTRQYEILSYLLAGHDTTAHGLSWAIYCMGLHTDVQLKVNAEAERVLTSSPITFEKIKELEYTHRVFEEALRLYPPVWTMSRQAINDDEIPLDSGASLFVPSGTAIMMCQYAVHRRKQYWPHPEAFEPDRFLVSGDRPQYAWFPFGGGPRVCLGARFSQIEASIALSMITQRYELSLLPGQNIKPHPIITLRPSGKMLFAVKKRPPKTQEVASYVPAEQIAAQICPFQHASR